jgi:hypothetical protein
MVFLRSAETLGAFCREAALERFATTHDGIMKGAREAAPGCAFAFVSSKENEWK